MEFLKGFMVRRDLKITTAEINVWGSAQIKGQNRF